MLISLDYDDTYTLDPSFWRDFVALAEAHGHDVICTTMRTPAEGELMDSDFRDMVKVFYTSREAKMRFLEKKNIFPDVWVDDTPLFINFGASR